VQVLKFCKLSSIANIRAQQDPIRLEDERVARGFNKLEQSKQVPPAHSWLVPAYTDLRITTLAGDRVQLAKNLLRAVEAPHLLGVRQRCPTPAKGTTQAAPHTVGCGYAAVKTGGPETIVFTQVVFRHNSFQPRGKLDRIIHVPHLDFSPVT
jgi:hypothetical protein